MYSLLKVNFIIDFYKLYHLLHLYCLNNVSTAVLDIMIKLTYRSYH